MPGSLQSWTMLFIWNRANATWDLVANGSRSGSTTAPHLLVSLAQELCNCRAYLHNRDPRHCTVVVSSSGKSVSKVFHRLFKCTGVVKNSISLSPAIRLRMPSARFVASAKGAVQQSHLLQIFGQHTTVLSRPMEQPDDFRKRKPRTTF